MIELQLKGKTYFPVRYKLREWLEFEKTQEAIAKAVESKNIDEYTKQVNVLISTAIIVPIEDIEDAPWYETASAYSVITSLNKIKEIPLLKSDPSKQKKEIPWEYDGRSWFWWVNIFAKSYGWSQETISKLDIDDAVSLLQEVLIDDQLQKEWEWGLSEASITYNKNTKKSEFNPLPRPAWMSANRVVLPATKVKFRKGSLPVGRIIGEDGSERIVYQ